MNALLLCVVLAGPPQAPAILIGGVIPQAPPIEVRMDNLEKRVDYLERMQKTSVPPPPVCNCEETGKCICEDGKCQCLNCPIHRQKGLAAKPTHAKPMGDGWNWNEKGYWFRPMPTPSRNYTPSRNCASPRSYNRSGYRRVCGPSGCRMVPN